MQGPSPVEASGGHSSSRCAGFSPSRPLLLQSTGSRRAGSVAVAHGPSSSAACGILPDQGSNPRPLHWQADSQPLHQGKPATFFLVPFLSSRWGPFPTCRYPVASYFLNPTCSQEPTSYQDTSTKFCAHLHFNNSLNQRNESQIVEFQDSAR